MRGQQRHSLSLFLSLSVSLCESRLWGHCGEKPGGQTAPHIYPQQDIAHTLNKFGGQDSQLHHDYTLKTLLDAYTKARQLQTFHTSCALALTHKHTHYTGATTKTKKKPHWDWSQWLSGLMLRSGCSNEPSFLGVNAVAVHLSCRVCVCLCTCTCKEIGST